jgi:hypothetical protein
MFGFTGKKIACANMPPRIQDKIFAGYKVLPGIQGNKIAGANTVFY